MPCDTYASDLGDKLVSDYQNPKASRGRPKRLLSDNNHIKMIPFRWFVTQTDKVHYVDNTGIETELIMTCSFFEDMEITDARISRKGGTSYLKHSRKLSPQIKEIIQHEHHIS